MARKKGYKHTEETKKKMSEAHKGKKNSEAAKQKMSEAAKRRKIPGMKGKKHSEVTKQKISVAARGRSPSEETRRKMSVAARRRSGLLASRWRGGLSFEHYGRDFNEKLRNQIREGQSYECLLCEKQSTKTLSVHHVDYDKQNNDSSNLCALCGKCHAMTNGNRVHWQGILTQLMVERKTVPCQTLLF